uniref:Uncharacterized protein n=1 Tax=Suricata suricatta TaxID=37032 RepID=A0A673U065_SURSU
MTFATKSNNQNLIVFLNKIQTTIIGYKGDFLAILDQLDPDTLPDGRIWLFGLNPYFFQHNFFCMGSASKRVGLQGCAQMGFLVPFIVPLLVLLVATELPGSTKTTTLAHPASTAGLTSLFSQTLWPRAPVTIYVPLSSVLCPPLRWLRCLYTQEVPLWLCLPGPSTVIF